MSSNTLLIKQQNHSCGLLLTKWLRLRAHHNTRNKLEILNLPCIPHVVEQVSVITVHMYEILYFSQIDSVMLS